MPTTALEQPWPRAVPVGKEALSPILVTNPMPAAMIGYTGAAKVEMLSGWGGYTHLSCPWEIAQVG